MPLPYVICYPLIELKATVAAYNMVSRFLEAMVIHSDDKVE
jgi:hypothetical protein